MLARAFLSAEALKLNAREHKTLIKILGMMERGELKHVPMGMSSLEIGEFTGHFNMQYFNVKRECGTICCIGGTARLLAPEESFPTCDRYNLRNLFYPIDSGLPWENISVEMAARALHNYLTTGHANWKEACNAN